MDAKEILILLSHRADEIIPIICPNATKHGHRWQMGNLDGAPGSSCGIYRGKGGVYLATDNGETVNLLDLWRRNAGLTWSETLLEARKFLGVSNVQSFAPPKEKPIPRVDNIRHLQSVSSVQDYLANRGINPEVAELYKVREHARHSKFNQHFIGYGYLDSSGDFVMFKSTGIQRTPDGKKDIWSTTPYYTLWGWWLVTPDTKSILITEGEEDAMAMHQLLTLSGVTDIVCLSMPNGTDGLGWIENDYEMLQQFETIYIATDWDDKGEPCAQKLSQRLGRTRCLRVLVNGVKDANEWLKLHPSNDDVLKMLSNAAPYDPKTIKDAGGLTAGVMQEAARGAEERRHNPFIFPELPFRYRRGENILIYGYPFHGKSNFAYQTILHEMSENKRKCCIASFEIPAAQMLYNMLWMRLGKMPTEEHMEEDIGEFADQLKFIEVDEGETVTWESLRNDFLYAAKRWGCDLFMIDSLMFLTSKKDVDGQDNLSKECSKFANANDVTVLLICHADAKKSGNDKVPELEDVLGGQGIGAAAHSAVAVWRNKKKEKETEQKGFADHSQHDAVLYVSKQRANGHTVWRNLWFNAANRCYSLHGPDENGKFADATASADKPF